MLIHAALSCLTIGVGTVEFPLRELDTTMSSHTSSFSLPSLPTKPGQRLAVGQLHGAALSWALCVAAQSASGVMLVVTPDAAAATQLEHELQFFNTDTQQLPVWRFPDWETLPYDHFSPHPDIISARLTLLHQLTQARRGIVLVASSTLMQRIAPCAYVSAHSFVLQTGESLLLAPFRQRMVDAGYHAVAQVMQHGEYAVRGSIVDVFPMGSAVPYRLDLFGDSIDSIRSFDPETQRTIAVITAVNVLPAHEFPLDAAGITHFRQMWREHFAANPLHSTLYQSVSNGESAAGIEYYLPLFFDHTATFLDYLPDGSVVTMVEDVHAAVDGYWREINERYEQLRYDQERPILPPATLFLAPEMLFAACKPFPQLHVQAELLPDKSYHHNFATQAPPQLLAEHQAAQPLHRLAAWLMLRPQRVLFCAETPGRREVLEGLLDDIAIRPQFFATWQDFYRSDAAYGISVAPVDRGLYLEDPPLVLIAESQLFGQQVMQRRLRKGRVVQADAIVRNLTELRVGAPVVHSDHGVGRYLGLQTIKTGDSEAEYLTLEYAGEAKLYVPVTALHLISRYGGADTEHAPLHRLGSGQWEKVKRKAKEKMRDVAAELLHIYAQRAAHTGFACAAPDHHYLAFAAAFPFEVTPDQQQAIEAVIADMTVPRSMDRVICGDVGFGKTEVAMRAAFIAVQSHQQVGVLAPTTLLAEQHLHSFQDRFANWPVRIEAISRFRSAQEQDRIIADLQAGKIDILIGTHKLLQPRIMFKSLGLLIVDEEHRFGVRQKERIKAVRAAVDLLTLTATPIPRTLNMALANIRDLSIIATPPARRLSVKTFVRPYNQALIREAILRENLRGGQVYFLHNEVHSIERMAEELRRLVPEARIVVAHGQMREATLEQVMVDFYHRRFTVLVCSTIIESGIDIPNANTIIINRADRLGLAQLHQLRGRVGRSHHQAYAFLLTPEPDLLTADAEKRLTAIAALEELGAGFTLASHDLEIRGAGELLGEEQSGHIHELGFTLYMELLEETVAALKAGKEPLLDKPAKAGVEVDLHLAALLPEDYIGDVHIRLMFYQRIANIVNREALDDLQAELVDRFGPLPPQAKCLFRIAVLKQAAQPLGVNKIQVGSSEGVIEFIPNPPINMAALLQLIQQQPQHYKLTGSERIRFTVNGVDADAKFKAVETLLARLR